MEINIDTLHKVMYLEEWAGRPMVQISEAPPMFVALADIPVFAGKLMDFYEKNKPKKVDYPGSAPVREALRKIASHDPDRAGTLNGVGFNKMDGVLGHSLAEQEVWTERQLEVAKRFVNKYRRQLIENWGYNNEDIGRLIG